MRIAVLCDIHGNLPALEAVLAEVEGEAVDHVVIGGDVVPGPMPTACIARLDALATPWSWLFGNGERDVARTARSGMPDRVPAVARPLLEWTAAQLDAATLERFEALPATVRLDGAPRVLFCHATPRDEFEIFTLETPDAVLRPIFDAADADLVVCGHTHMPFDRRVGDVRVVNAGSVGLPFGEPGAFWLLLDGDDVQPRRTEYDRAAAEAMLGATDWPGTVPLVDPPGQAAMLAAFRHAEIGR